MKHLLFLFALLIAGTANAQAPNIQWQNTIGGSGDDVMRSIEQTSDGGYILGGNSDSNISGDKTENSQGGGDYWVVKLDSLGSIQWQNTIGGSLNDALLSVQQCSDGGYVLGGFSRSNISGDKTENCHGSDDYWVVKLDAAGVIQWQNTIGGNAQDILYSIQQTNDGGYVLGGWSNSDISGDKTENTIGGIDYWVVKLDSAGSIQWQNTIGGSGSDLLHSVQQTTDSGYVLGGYSSSNIGWDKTENSQGIWDYWVVKLDASGIIQWQNTIGGSIEDYLFSVRQTNDGGYVLGGNSVSNISGDKTENSQGGEDYWVVKLDASGIIQWQNTIGGSDLDNPTSVKQASDGGYVLGGHSRSNISGDKTENSQGGDDYWVVKLDTAGIIQWQNTIGGSGIDWLYSIQQCTDGGYVLGGSSTSTISGDKTENSLGWDYWVVRLCGWITTVTSDVHICIGDSALVFGNYETIAGTYYDSLNTMSGCDSIIETTMVVNPTFNINDPQLIICSGDTVLIYGNYESTAGTYYDSLSTINGCDSIHSTVVIVDPTYYFIDPPWAICNGDSIFIYGNYESMAGIYYDSLLTFCALDSVHSTILTTHTIDTSITFSGDTLTANESGASYQWYDCNTMIIIPGANGQFFVPVAPGNYAVLITHYYCQRNSGCHTVGIEQHIKVNHITLFPNPTTGKFTVQGASGEIQVYNLFGRQVLSTRETEIDMRGYAKGVYFIRVEEVVRKVVLQ